MRARRNNPPETSRVDALDVDASAYQLTLAAMIIPLGMHIAFNGVSAVSMILLGHVWTAAAAFAASCAADAVFRWRIVRWLADSAGVDPAAGFRKLAALCAVRVSILLTPVVVLALRGGAAEIAYFGTVFCIFAVLAGSNGSFSRAVFWAYAGPAVVASAIVTLVAFPGARGVAIMLSVLSLATLLAIICEGTTRAVTGWHLAFSDSRALVSDLEVARDHAVTEREAADQAREDARRANRAKSNFLATMSHEIRTPMNGVLGMAQLLKRDEADPAQARRLDTLIESGEYLLSILNDILDVSKVDAGRLEILPQPEDLPLFLDRVVAFWSARADEQGVTLRLRADGELPHHIWMDALRLRQVLFNLIGNALKFTNHGAVTVSASARPHGEAAVWLHLAITDTGPGIPADDLPRLFERFSQVDDSEGRKFGGTGLGLAIAKQLTELMGGRIWVESEVGRGSAFHIEAAFDIAQARRRRAGPGGADGGAYRRRQPRQPAGAGTGPDRVRPSDRQGRQRA
jgi:signal transduction histidine kinase